MMKKILALALAGALSLMMLASCAAPGGGKDGPAITPAPEPTESLSPPGVESVLPGEIPSFTEPPAPTATGTPAPIPEPGMTAQPAPMPQPDDGKKPADSATETPAVKPSIPPRPSETPVPEPTVSVVKSTWNQVADLNRPALIDMDAALLSDLYGIEAGDLEEFVAKMPAMSSSVSEFLIAKCAPGRAEAVKQACQSRQAALAADDRYPESVQLVKDYRLVTSGDYLLFAIDEHADAMVSAFNTFAK